MSETKITHFNKVSAVNGFYVGASSAGETKVVSSTGQIYGDENIILTANVGGTIGAYIVAPFDMKMDACYADIAGGALGTAVILQLFANDTAGTALCTAISMGASAATAGSGLVTVGTLSTATVTALSSIVVLATSGTACETTVTILGHRV
jgi:hypothetical protein